MNDEIDVNEHMIDFNVEKHKCIKCDKSYETNIQLELHMIDKPRYENKKVALKVFLAWGQGLCPNSLNTFNHQKPIKMTKM